MKKSAHIRIAIFPAAGGNSKRSSGFTLVELSVVLIIVSVIVGMTAVSGVTMLGSARLTATQQKMAAIDQALMAYRMSHDQLPCPSDLTATQGSSYYGTAKTSAGYCQKFKNASSGLYGVRTYLSTGTSAQILVAEGGIPTSDLGLPYDFMYDGWGNRFRYAVDVLMANTSTNTNTFHGTEAGATCGSITIQGDPMPKSPNAYGGSHNYTRSNGGMNFNGAIYALISHGPNGFGAFTANGQITTNTSSSNADEQANCNCTSTGAQNASGAYTPTYVQEQPYIYNTSNPLYNFDDIVTYKERWQMQGPSDTLGTSCPRVYVADANNNRVQILDMNQNYIGQINPTGSCSGDAGAFNGAYGVAADNANHVWVIDEGYNRVVEFAVSNSGTATPINYLGGATACTSGTGSGGSSNGEFINPMQGAVDSNGNIWVQDEGNSRVQEFNSSGTFVNAVGCGYGTAVTNGCATQGTAAANSTITGALEYPFGANVDAHNNVWVADTYNNRIVEFNSSGIWLQNIGGGGINSSNCTGSGSYSTANCPSGTGNYYFSRPMGVYTDTFNNIWVEDQGNNRIEIFTNSGTFITSLSYEGGNEDFGAVDASGYQWASGNNQSIIKCHCPGALSSCSALTCTSVGSSGTGPLQFDNPDGFSIPPPSR